MFERIVGSLCRGCAGTYLAFLAWVLYELHDDMALHPPFDRSYAICVAD